MVQTCHRTVCLRRNILHRVCHVHTGLQKGIFIMPPHELSLSFNDSKEVGQCRYYTNCLSCFFVFIRVQTIVDCDMPPEKVVYVAYCDCCLQYIAEIKGAVQRF